MKKKSWCDLFPPPQTCPLQSGNSSLLAIQPEMLESSEIHFFLSHSTSNLKFCWLYLQNVSKTLPFFTASIIPSNPAWRWPLASWLVTLLLPLTAHSLFSTQWPEWSIYRKISLKYSSTVEEATVRPEGICMVMFSKDCQFPLHSGHPTIYFYQYYVMVSITHH